MREKQFQDDLACWFENSGIGEWTATDVANIIRKWQPEIKSLTLECPECGAPETDIAVGELNADRSQEAHCQNCGYTGQVEEFEK